VSGARPVAIGLALMIEEGLSIALLERVLRSAAEAAARARVAIVAGDTKVVPRGAVDKLFIAASGIGVRVPPSPVGPTSLRPGDAILVTGPIGRHGIAVMNAREGLAIQPEPMSDCAPLTPLVEALRSAGVPVRAMRDATRGGVAAVLHEWAAACGHSLAVVEADVPVSPDVVGACELLGLDPLHVANEGTMVVAVCPEAADRALESLRSAPLACQAARIGQVQQRGLSPVVVQRALGRFQPLDEPAGAPLPRIC